MHRAGIVIGEKKIKVRVADTFLSRLRGLLGESGMGENEGLLIRPCRQVHTFGMSFAIDVVFLSGTGKVLHVINAMKPGRVSPGIPNCRQVLELNEGSAARFGILPGLQAALEPLVPQPVNRRFSKIDGGEYGNKHNPGSGQGNQKQQGGSALPAAPEKSGFRRV